MFEIIIGIISGIFSGMGMGGGTILILLLSLFMNMDQRMAQATNLVFFIPTALSAIIIGIKNKNIQWKLSIKIILFGVLGTFLGFYISNKLNVELLRKLFGVFLLIIAGYEIFNKKYIKVKKRHNNKKTKKEGL